MILIGPEGQLWACARGAANGAAVAPSSSERLVNLGTDSSIVLVARMERQRNAGTLFPDFAALIRATPTLLRRDGGKQQFGAFIEPGPRRRNVEFDRGRLQCPQQCCLLCG
jgi:hypothetical protein